MHESWFNQIPVYGDLARSIQHALGLSFIEKSHVHYIEHVTGAIFLLFVVSYLVFSARRQIARAAATGDALVPDARFTARNFFEVLSSAVLNLMKDIIGPEAKRFFPLIATLAIFIFMSNVLGLIPGFVPPTDNLNTTAACGLIVFLFYQAYGVRATWEHLVHEREHHGHTKLSAGAKVALWPLAFLKYLSHFANPVGAWWGYFLAPLMFPIEIISHFARPMSLALRLMGNIMGDHKVFGIFLGIVPLVVPMPFLVLGSLVAVIQTFVFCLLSTVYVSMAVAHE
ncbi:MAG: F0F1 ATP synthase subunit A [Deltaproteobacteria bacterium]|nr:F0F1 ATP synthase subunit A [Deltaproteobacteria bacterium]